MIIFNSSLEPEKLVLLSNPTDQTNFTKDPPMETALYQNQEVTPSEFRRLAGSDWLKTKKFAYCKICDSVAHPWGTHIPDKPDRFDHENNVSGCPLSAKPDPRYAALKPIDVDVHKIATIRQSFLNSEIGTRAFAFCAALTSRKIMTDKVFDTMLAQADRLKIWGYRDAPPWTFAYMMLTLVDFETPVADKPPQSTQFQFVKPAKSPIDIIWNGQRQCTIKKIFRDSGKACMFPVGNPYPVSEAFFWSEGGR